MYSHIALLFSNYTDHIYKFIDRSSNKHFQGVIQYQNNIQTKRMDCHEFFSAGVTFSRNIWVKLVSQVGKWVTDAIPDPHVQRRFMHPFYRCILCGKLQLQLGWRTRPVIGNARPPSLPRFGVCKVPMILINKYNKIILSKRKY